MNKPAISQILIIGVTLFSMFFGAGNLIFSPLLGALSGTSVWSALSGFLISAVVFPILSVLIISNYKNAYDMVSRISPLFAVLFISVIYLLIGPFIAIPRTATTSMEMLGWLFPDTWLFKIVYIVLFFTVCTITAWRPGRLKDILGKIVGPILVLLVLILCFGSLFLPFEFANPVSPYDTGAFMNGINDGYQTMDILAAFCFGSVILINIDQLGFHDQKEQRSVLKKSAVAAGLLLAALYSMLALAAAIHAGEFQYSANGAQILSGLAEWEFGTAGSVMISLIFLAACYNVCSGLLSCCSQYFYNLSKKGTYTIWLCGFALFGAFVSIFGLDSILGASAPVLSFICPIAVLLLLWGWIMQIRKKAQSAD